MQPTASELRHMNEPRDELAEVPPDTNLDLQDCSEEEWRRYREEQAARLMEAAAKIQSTPSSSVVGGPISTMQALDSVTAASAVSTMKSGTLGTLRSQRSTIVPDRDLQDLQKMFDFHKQDQSWKVPIISYKDKILDMVGGKKINLLSITGL